MIVFINSWATIYIMKHYRLNQSGFIPMILTLLAILIAVIIFAYLRVQNAHQ